MTKPKNITRNVVRRREHERLEWSEERDKMLRDLLGMGLSSAAAAQRMGISKNAAVGRASRLGIVYGRTADKERASRQNIIPLPRSKKISPSAAVEGMRDVQTRKDEPVPIGKPGCPPEDDACRWVSGDPSSNNWKFCGHPQKDSSVYCAHHHARAYHHVPHKGNVIPLKLNRSKRTWKSKY